MTNTNICDLTKKNASKFPERTPDSHKGDYGRVLLIGGSFGMSGAIALAGRAAILSGAGLVKLAVPKSTLPLAAGYAPELMTVPLPETRSGKIAFGAYERLLPLIDEADVIAIGPGLGRSGGLDGLVLRLNREVRKPMLIDADALNALAAYDFKHMAASFAEAIANGASRVLTPHPGEFARLCHGLDNPAKLKTTTKIPRDTPGRIAVACHFLEQLNAHAERTESRSNDHVTGAVILVLKGAQTIVTDGCQVFVNTSGNPGMATGGSGDVLSGMIVSLIGQHFSPLDAAKTGVFLHGRAADLALVQSRIPFESITATTLINHIGAAIREMQNEE